MKKKILAILAVIFVASIFTCTVSAHYDTAYWHEERKTQTRSGWMDWIPDNRKVSELSLPGTHDTMAYASNLFGGDITRTQTMNLRQQLDSGIRVLDIRLKYTSESQLDNYHGIVYLGTQFEDVLRPVKDFLASNPTEAVFIRVKQENSSVSDTQMKKAFDYYYNRYKNIFYTGGQTNPTFGQLRGKIVLLSDVASLHSYGIPYRSMNIQDSYSLSTNWDLYSKWEKIKSQLVNSNNRNNTNQIYANYLSASGGSFPYFVASGHSSPGTSAPRLSTALTHPGFAGYYPDFPRDNRFLWFATIYFEGTNTLTANYLNNNNVKYAGIVMADFPGERLINAIIQCNRR